MAILGQKSPIFKAHLQSTPLGFGGNRRSTAKLCLISSVLPSKSIILPWLQSHHSGIESRRGRGWVSPCLPSYNRTIVGLKVGLKATKPKRRDLLQSHHSGIERKKKTLVSCLEGWLQSHHSGIESSVSISAALSLPSVTIAP